MNRDSNVTQQAFNTVNIKCCACSLNAVFNVALNGKRSVMCSRHAHEFAATFRATIEPIANLRQPNQPRVWRF